MSGIILEFYDVKGMIALDRIRTMQPDTEFVLNISEIEDGNVMIGNHLSLMANPSSKMPNVKIDIRGLNFGIQDFDFLYYIISPAYGMFKNNKFLYKDFTNDETALNSFNKAVYNKVKKDIILIKYSNRSDYIVKNFFTDAIKLLEAQMDFYLKIACNRLQKRIGENSNSEAEANLVLDVLQMDLFSEILYEISSNVSVLDPVDFMDEQFKEKLLKYLTESNELMSSHNNMIDFTQLEKEKVGTVHLEFKEEFKNKTNELMCEQKELLKRILDSGYKFN